MGAPWTKKMDAPLKIVKFAEAQEMVRKIAKDLGVRREIQKSLEKGNRQNVPRD